VNRRDGLAVLLFLALGAFFFAPLLFGDATLIPFDNLFRFPPWSAFRAQFGITVPQNELVSDLVLENYAWKNFIAESLRARELPLWNPYLFTGVPFLAAGQHSALYPFSLLFYILPLERAYGIFVALQFILAMLTTYAFARVLGLARIAAALAAIVFAFSGFFVVSLAFPMVISAVAWLPAILACVELIVRAKNSARALFYAMLGALFLGIQFFAGHIEISIYNLLITAFYAAGRMVSLSRGSGGARVATRWLFLIGGMTATGIALGAAQLVPLYELVQNNFRSGSASYEQIISYAYPLRQIITFFIPNFFGNPAHHSYFDVFDFTTRAAPSETIFWGIKNYVEAGAWVGIVPFALAVLAIASSFKSHAASHLRPATWLFAALALISLAFIFGTPLYAILFFGVPGFNQLHTPFRWVYPYTLCLAMLAGIGAEFLNSKWNEHGKNGSSPAPLLPRSLAWFAIWLGIAILAALAVSYLARNETLAILDRFVQSSALASPVFEGGRMFYSYEFRHIFLFAIFLVGAGAVIRIAHSPIYLPARWGRMPAWQAFALALVALELFISGIDFYPKTDARLKDFTPPAVKFLQQDASLFRITSYDAPNEKVFNANAGMLYGLHDIRGYDSIIPKPYADLMNLLAPQDELLYNRIAAFYDPAPLSSPLIHLLNVKYVLTTRPLPNAGYTLAYDGADLKIYRNERVLPRAFIVPHARVIPNRAALLEAMQRFDPAREVLLDVMPPAAHTLTNACAHTPVEISKYSFTQIVIKSNQPCGGWLVLSDAYFNGWLAQIDGADTQLYRADYNFRAVFVPAGEHTIRFRYSPVSFRVGAVGSFLGAMVLLLAGAYLVWRRFYRADAQSQISIVAKNSLLPMATSLVMKFLTLAFALVSLRILGPTGTGRYAFAVTLWFFADTITDFGLGILLTREVSRDKAQANRYLTNSAILRVLLWLASLIPVALVTLVYTLFFNLTLDTAAALALLMIGILPGTLAASLAFLFNAYEHFEYRIAVDFAMRLISIALGVVALTLGFGFLGLAVVSILVNVLALAAFYFLVRRALFVPRAQVDRPLIRWMFFESFPLMFNNLLSSIFFRIDALILQPLKGDAVLGYYNTAYKFIDALNFIPSNFTLAIFPALARLAADQKDAMARAFILALKILLWISLPLTVGTLFVADDLIRIFGGDDFLPHSAIALQALIWFLPFSFVNSVTHYVLIALGQQRFLTKAFIAGVTFNIVGNLIVIPHFSYVGAAVTTILSEIVLLVPFFYAVRKNLAPIPLLAILWRPALAAALMGAALWLIVPHIGLLLAIPVAGFIYGGLLLLFGALGADERALLQRLLPARVKKVLRIND